MTVLHKVDPTLEVPASRLAGCEVLVLLRERSAISDALLEQLPQLRMSR